ncbi:thiamine phosphate synthase [Sphingobium sp. DEHP117]|uniref:thiamine phosphate synthase n=1 Tax=Sphingobium sp. DEHP117 TaxID=2993436 RepID=UPI0027D64324|nr:thiamine phosphate synthase [Sphingobium sp. DEHP117]MDQ4421760.1 thiamine phosphate synthase [Sphingobium sp. DEHP117]
MRAAIEGDMLRRQPPSSLPRLWLFTDERVEEAHLLRAIARLPRGAGVVFRHYGLEREARRDLFDKVVTLARRHGLLLLAAGDVPGRGAHGVHRPAHAATRRKVLLGLVSAAVHDMRQLAAAYRAGADIVFISPVFPTRSHPGGQTLGPMHFATLTRRARCPVIALGGMTPARFRRLKPLGAHGWAAIDALC